MHIVFFFFFSSRRRHTRSDRDWSSDVCSSDLRGFSASPWQKAAGRKLRSAPEVPRGLPTDSSEEFGISRKSKAIQKLPPPSQIAPWSAFRSTRGDWTRWTEKSC